MIRTLRSRLALAMGVLVLGTIGAAFICVDLVIDRFTESELEQDIAASHRSFNKFFADRCELLTSRADLLADAPHLKALLAIEDLDGPTAHDAARGLAEKANVELLVLATHDGEILGESRDGCRDGHEQLSAWLMDSRQPRSRVLRHDGDLVHLAISEIVSGNQINGYAIVGKRLDHTFPSEVEVIVGGNVVLLDGDGHLIQSESAKTSERDMAALRRIGSRTQTGRVYTTLGGVEYQGTSILMGDGAQLLLLRPLADVVMLFDRIRMSFVITGAIIALLGLLVGRTVAERLSTPIRSLIGASRSLASGELTARVALPGNDEVGDLGRSFNRMAERIQLRNEEIELTNRDLEEARDAAEDANRAKTEFLANISHELRTPLGGVIGMNDILLLTELDEEQREYGTIVASCARSLLALINDVLDFSKIEAGKLTIENQEFEIDEVLENTIEYCAHDVNEKGLDLIYDVSNSVPERVFGDPVRVRQVLVNLLGNAVKFTEHGTVTLSVIASGNELRFSVKDTGVGIPEPDQARVFDKFHQADGSMSRRFEGTGLGLAICRHLVELMGGTIEVASELGIGSEFSFCIPLTHGEVSDPPDPVPWSRAIVVDDGSGRSRALGQMLSAYVANVTCVSSGAECIVACKSESTPAIVFVSFTCGDPELLEYAGSDSQQHRFVQVVPRGRRPRKDARYSGIGTTPWTPRRLRSVLVHQATSVECGDGETTTVSTTDGQFVLVADDNAVNRRILTRYAERLGFATQTAVDGREAVRLFDPHETIAVLTDIHMPHMNGLEAAREMRKQASDIRVPIIAITADVTVEQKKDCLDAGMDDFLTKPISFDKIRKTLAKYFELA